MADGAGKQQGKEKEKDKFVIKLRSKDEKAINMFLSCAGCSVKDWPIHKLSCDRLKANQVVTKTLAPDLQHFQFALSKFITSISSLEIIPIRQVAHFPSFHTSPPGHILVHLDFAWDSEVAAKEPKNYRAQFRLLRGKVTTEEQLQKDMGIFEEIGKSLKRLEEESKQVKELKKGMNRTPASGAEKGSNIRLAIFAGRKLTSKDDTRTDMAMFITGLYIHSFSPSSLDNRNESLGWIYALQRSLSMPPLPSSKGIENFNHIYYKRLLECYAFDEEWIKRSREGKWKLEDGVFEYLLKEEDCAGDDDGAGKRELRRNRNAYGYVTHPPVKL